MNLQNSEDTSVLAKQVLALARDTIVVRFRFFDKAIASIVFEEAPQSGVYSAGAGRLSYDPVRLLRDFRDDENYVVRLLLHVIFHNIFMHHLRDDIANTGYWKIACDIAVENAVLAVAKEYRRLNDTQVQIILAKLTNGCRSCPLRSCTGNSWLEASRSHQPKSMQSCLPWISMIQDPMTTGTGKRSPSPPPTGNR